MVRLPKISYLECIIQLGVPQTCRPGHDVPLLTIERWHIFADLLHHLQGVHLQGFNVLIGGNTNFQKNLPFQCSSPLQAGHQQNYLGQSLESPKFVNLHQNSFNNQHIGHKVQKSLEVTLKSPMLTRSFANVCTTFCKFEHKSFSCRWWQFRLNHLANASTEL